MEWLIEHTAADVNSTNRVSSSVAMYCCDSAHTHTHSQPQSCWMLQRSSTCLSLACYRGHYKLCKWLVDTVGMDPNMRLLVSLSRVAVNEHEWVCMC
jgi:hypothetical protein